MRVLQNAKAKIERYNKTKIFDEKYNKAYHDLLMAREKNICLVDENGGVSDSHLSIVERTLIAFEMKAHGQMDSQFKEKLRNKLENNEIRKFLRLFREFTVLSPQIWNLKKETGILFEELASKEKGLDANGNHFGVGAAKIMNFLFPELFVIMDSNVRLGLELSEFSTFKNYWQIMTICHEELEEWQSEFGTLENIIHLDNQPTTLPRIFDKCAFVMGLEKRASTSQY